MKKLISSLLTPVLAVVLLVGCQPRTDTGEALDFVGYDSFGDTSQHAASTADVLTPVQLVSAVATMEGKTITVSGTVREVCQMAGCWLTLDSADESGALGTTIRISVPRDENGDYVFTVPTDISGRNVFVTGVVEQQEVDAAMAEHYAEDAAKMAEQHSEEGELADGDSHDEMGDHDDNEEHADGDSGDEMGEHDDAAAAEAPAKEIRITAVGVSLSPVKTTP